MYENALRYLMLSLILCYPTASFAKAAKESKATKKETRAKKRAKKRKNKPPVFQSVTVGQRAPEDPFRSARSISVLDRKTIEERRPRTTPEALQETPGVFLQKTNHGGGAPIIRGGVGPQVLILIDGVRLNSSTFRSGPNQYLNLLDPWSIGALEVLKGPGSLMYGSYAFGGVLNIRTQNPEMSYSKEWKVGARLVGKYASSDQERSGYLALTGSVMGVAIQANVAYGSFGDLRPGQPTFDSTNKILLRGKENVLYQPTTYGDLVIDPATGGQAFSGYENLYVGVKAKWRIAPGWKLEALYRHTQLLNQGRSDQFAAKRSMRYYDNWMHFGYLRLKTKFSKTRLRVTLSAQEQREKVYRRRFDAGEPYTLSRESINRDATMVIGASIDGYTKATPWLKLSYGVDVYRDVVESEAEQRRGEGSYQTSTPTYPEGVDYMTVGGHISAKFRLLRGKEGWGLYLNVGDRLNGFMANAPARDSFEAVSFAQLGNALYGSLQFLMNRNLNVSFSYSEGFRAPNLQESAFIGDAGNNFEIPNPDLRPEISRTLELTLRARNKRFFGWVTGYVSFWNDLIVSASAQYNGQDTVDGKAVKQRVNKANARVLGVEVGAGIRLWRSLRLTGHATWTEGRAIDDGGIETPLSRIPPLFGKVSLRYDFKRRGFLEIYTLFADQQTALSQRDRDDPRVPVCGENAKDGCVDGTPGWITLNIRGGVRLHRHVQLLMSVENVFNTLYKPHASGVFAAGLNARATLDLKF
ncbi:MAG: hypothetical protein CL920_28405 [Deltaproteobacteria bacterium]|nr:hypothetical protein [Deltaproteobacteria bacterium]|tara:strand:+ start:464 stop:2722 length:2259 start_codon:yes stop_codon:yes gene_type:complete